MKDSAPTRTSEPHTLRQSALSSLVVVTGCTGLGQYSDLRTQYPSRLLRDRKLQLDRSTGQTPHQRWLAVSEEDQGYISHVTF